MLCCDCCNEVESVTVMWTGAWMLPPLCKHCTRRLPPAQLPPNCPPSAQLPQGNRIFSDPNWRRGPFQDDDEFLEVGDIAALILQYLLIFAHSAHCHACRLILFWGRVLGGDGVPAVARKAGDACRV